MKTLTLIAALAVPSGWALAQGVDGRTVWNPPPQYDRPYRGVLTVHMLPQSQVPAACADLFREAGRTPNVTPFQKGCAWRRRGSCRVIMINHIYLGITPEAVLRHEIGHCNGWPSHHPEN